MLITTHPHNCGRLAARAIRARLTPISHPFLPARSVRRDSGGMCLQRELRKCVIPCLCWTIPSSEAEMRNSVPKSRNPDVDNSVHNVRGSIGGNSCCCGEKRPKVKAISTIGLSCHILCASIFFEPLRLSHAPTDDMISEPSLRGNATEKRHCWRRGRRPGPARPSAPVLSSPGETQTTPPISPNLSLKNIDFSTAESARNEPVKARYPRARDKITLAELDDAEPQLPPGWEKATDASGTSYYVCGKK